MDPGTVPRVVELGYPQAAQLDAHRHEVRFQLRWVVKGSGRHGTVSVSRRVAK